MAKGQKATPRWEWAQGTREKQNEWRRKNRSNLSADMPKELADSFRNYCKSQGKSVSAVLTDYVRSVVMAMENETSSEIQDVSSNFQDGSGSDTPGTVDLPTANDTPGTVD